MYYQRILYFIGVDFYSKALEIDGKIISLQLWDTAGQERFQSVTKAYYRGAQGIILVYDISQEESFIAVKSWISTIQVCIHSGASEQGTCWGQCKFTCFVLCREVVLFSEV